MHETYQKTSELCELKDRLTEWTKGAMAMGKDAINTEELGEVIDMIKDLADAEKNCWKACYYKYMVGEMTEDDGRSGYDNWRYSSGRFAPKGRGHRSGYMPPMKEGMFWDNQRMGYPHDGVRTSYDMYRDARRHYTDTHAQTDKDEMESHAMSTLKEIWEEADPELRQKMKRDIMNMM